MTNRLPICASFGVAFAIALGSLRFAYAQTAEPPNPERAPIAETASNRFTVIGFGVQGDSAVAANVRALAQAAQGRFLPAEDADELVTAMEVAVTGQSSGRPVVPAHREDDLLGYAWALVGVVLVLGMALLAARSERLRRTVRSRPLRGPTLAVWEPGQRVRRVRLRRPRTLVGRGNGCDLVVHDPAVSRQHARISWSDEHVVIEDLGSKNGMIVDGRHCERSELPAGADIELGRTRVVRES